MLLDSILAAVLLALFIGWGVIVLFVTLYHLAGNYLSIHIELLRRTTRQENDIGRLKHWMDKWFGVRIGFVTYHIGRRVGLAIWQEFTGVIDVSDLVVWALVLFCERP